MKIKESWFWDRIRQIHIDFHMPEFPKDAIKNFDAKIFIEEIIKAQANVIGVFTKCHFGNSFYNTKIGHKHNGLKGDFFGEVLEEAHKNEIKVIAYYSLATDEYAVKNNPDWYQIDINNKKRTGKGTVWNLPCINSPYREELVIPQIKEITKKYNIDGYIIDIPYNYKFNCFCMYCKKKFKKEYGFELDRKLMETNFEIIKKFNIDSAVRCMKEIRDTVKKIKPDVLISCNGAWKMGEPYELSDTCDYGIWESQPASGTFLCHSFKARYTRNLDVPVQIMTVRFTEDWGLMSCKKAEQLKYEFATIMANGGIINLGDQVMVDGSLQSGAYEIIKEAFEFVKKREEYCLRAKSIPHIALIANYSSNWLWDRGDSASLGAAKMLIESQQQFDIFYNNDFKKLDDYKVVIIPETVDLSKESIEKMKVFVEKGGLLIAEAQALLNKERKEFRLKEVFGLEFLEYSPYSFAYLTENEDLWEGNSKIPQLLDGDFIKSNVDKAKILSYIQWPYGESMPPKAFRHKMAPPNIISDFPAISLNEFGQGKAICISATIFRSYWENNHFWLKNIVNNCINKYNEIKPFYIDSIPSLEANLMIKSNKYYLHLINFQNSHTGNRNKAYYDPIEKIMAIHEINVKVRVNKTIKSVTLKPENTKLNYKLKNGMVQFTIPKLHIYSIVEIF